MQIRPINFETDETGLIEGGYAFWRELKMDFEFNPGHFLNFWKTVIGQGIGTILVADDVHTQRQVGGIGLVITPSPFTGLPTAGELFWYVDLDFRVTRVPVYLVKEAEQWARDHKAVELGMGYYLNGDNNDLHKVYEGLGFTERQRVFKKIL